MKTVVFKTLEDFSLPYFNEKNFNILKYSDRLFNGIPLNELLERCEYNEFKSWSHLIEVLNRKAIAARVLLREQRDKGIA